MAALFVLVALFVAGRIPLLVFPANPLFMAPRVLLLIFASVAAAVAPRALRFVPGSMRLEGLTVPLFMAFPLFMVLRILFGIYRILPFMARTLFVAPGTLPFMVRCAGDRSRVV